MKKEQTKRRDGQSWKIDPKSVFDTGIFYAARQALRRHASGGNTLMIATVLALIVANIPGINNLYFDFWEQEVRLQVVVQRVQPQRRTNDTARVHQRRSHGDILLHDRS